MAKKRNYENDEAYKNFRLEDYLPSMNRREPEAKISEPEQDTATEETALFPPLDAPDISAIQAAASETIRPDGQDVQEDEAGTDDADEEEVEIASVETEIPVKRTVTGRISSKQRRLSLEEYRSTYLQVPRITDRKPVFVSGEVRDRLDEIVRRLGGRGMSVSGLVENLARQHFASYGNDIEQWRKLQELRQDRRGVFGVSFIDAQNHL
ncbi:DUF3408 domain-containing protein [Phocaeicola vulgatus]|uniref:DUF3408 domain-containing protein n=2 Tax=Bacteroidales TaxID=171549 RepID=UPI0039B3829F